MSNNDGLQAIRFKTRSGYVETIHGILMDVDGQVPVFETDTADFEVGLLKLTGRVEALEHAIRTLRPIE